MKKNRTTIPGPSRAPNGSSPLSEGHPHAGKLSMPLNYFTVVRFTIESEAGGSALTVTQHGAPEHSADVLTAGWNRF